MPPPGVKLSAMFIGHFAPAFAAAAVSPESPRLGTLFVAAQLVDWAFMIFVLIGVEHMRVVPGITAMNPLDLYHMPYTHSLLGTLAFGAVFGAVVWKLTGRATAGLLSGLVVLSHWFTDLFVHRPDLTIAGGEDRLGWGLWNVPWAAITLELVLIVVAFVWYVRATKGPTGPVMVLGAALLLMQAVNWFGPQASEMDASVPISALIAFGVLTALATWVGRTRRHRLNRGLARAALHR